MKKFKPVIGDEIIKINNWDYFDYLSDNKSQFELNQIFKIETKEQLEEIVSCEGNFEKLKVWDKLSFKQKISLCSVRLVDEEFEHILCFLVSAFKDFPKYLNEEVELEEISGVNEELCCLGENFFIFYMGGDWQDVSYLLVQYDSINRCFTIETIEKAEEVNKFCDNHPLQDKNIVDESEIIFELTELITRKYYE